MIEHKYTDPILIILREYRVVTLLLISFMLYWGWDAYQFVNTHYSNMSDFVIAFYISIIAGAIWCIKFWTSSHATPCPIPKKINSEDL